MKKVLSAYKLWPNEKFEEFEPGMVKGEYTIIGIEYHEPAGEGDAHYIDVKMDDGAVRRIFKPDEVIFEEEA
jgi:hypothetical protein